MEPTLHSASAPDMIAYQHFLDRNAPGCRWISLSQVDLAPRWWHLEADALGSAISIRAREIRQNPRQLDVPVLLRETAPGAFEVLLGLTQVLAGRQAGYRSLGARVVVVEELAGALLALGACASHRHSSYLRKAWLLARILDYAGVSLSEVASSLPIASGTLYGYRRCARALPEEGLMRWASAHGIPAGQLLSIPKRELDPAIRARTPEWRAQVLSTLAQRIGSPDPAAGWWENVKDRVRRLTLRRPDRERRAQS